MEEVILVNERNDETGVMEKLEAHRKGVLHRAFSIFIFNNKNEMLLQQRAANKYHSPSLWTNACCSHPMPGEITEAAALRRLKEELGFETPLHYIFDFTYKETFENGLTEHEFDHVYTGVYNGDINFNSAEVQEVCYRSFDDIESAMQLNPNKFTAWFRIVFPMIKKWKNETVAVVS